MRARIVAGAVGLGCAGLTVLTVLTFVTPAAGQRATAGQACGSDCGMPDNGVAADCRDAMENTPPEGSGGLKLTADVPDGATVAPGQDIKVRLTWDPKQWEGRDLDMALACVRVKGGLDGNLSGEERPAANDGVFEYRIHVPDNIKADCDICVQGFIAGMANGGGPEQVGSDARCFMSGPPRSAPSAPQPPATPPAAQPPASAAAPAPATAGGAAGPVRLPQTVPNEVAGANATRPGTAPAPADAPAGELPRTGAAATRVGTAGGGLTLALGGLAVIGGAGRRNRRRTGI